jgi:hypothetical protein
MGVTPETLAKAGISPEMAAKMNPEQLAAMGASPEALAASKINPEKMAALGISPEMAAKMTPEQLTAMGASPSPIGQIGSPNEASSDIASGLTAQQSGALPSNTKSLDSASGLTQNPAEKLANASSTEGDLAANNSSSSNAANTSYLAGAAASAAVIPPLKMSSLKMSSPKNQDASNAQKADPNTSADHQQSAKVKDNSDAAIVLQDELSNPICGQKYEILLSDGSAIRGSTDENGRAFINIKLDNTCTLLLPELNQGAW